VLLLEFDSITGGFLSVILRLAIGVFICFFNSASLGIPGIGGVFFGVGVLTVRSGIPGVGVAPFGGFNWALPDKLVILVTGLDEIPGGIFA